MSAADQRAAACRAAREAFDLAQELGCTPREAEREMRRRRAAARRACGRKIETSSVDLLVADGVPAATFRDWNASWMMRN